jgi:hypothetical protein
VLKWKIFFWLSSFFISVAIISLPFAEIDLKFTDAVSLAVQVLGQFFIYGYAYQKEVGNRTIARIAFYLNLALCIYVIFISAKELIAESTIANISILAPGIALSLIVLVPLYLYTYKSENIWRITA